MNREEEKVRDARLVELASAGDLRAFEELVRLYQRPVFDVAYRMVHDAETSADITQATFLAAFEKLGSYDPAYKFFSWIYRIAINLALDYSSRKRVAAAAAHVAVIDQEPEGPHSSLEKERISKLGRKLLDELQEDYRAVIVLRHYSDLSYEEIAGVLDIPLKTVKSRLYSARQLLKAGLQENGYEL